MAHTCNLSTENKMRLVRCTLGCIKKTKKLVLVRFCLKIKHKNGWRWGSAWILISSIPPYHKTKKNWGDNYMCLQHKSLLRCFKSEYLSFWELNNFLISNVPENRKYNISIMFAVYWGLNPHGVNGPARGDYGFHRRHPTDEIWWRLLQQHKAFGT